MLIKDEKSYAFIPEGYAGTQCWLKTCRILKRKKWEHVCNLFLTANYFVKADLGRIKSIQKISLIYLRFVKKKLPNLFPWKIFYIIFNIYGKSKSGAVWNWHGSKSIYVMYVISRKRLKLFETYFELSIPIWKDL